MEGRYKKSTCTAGTVTSGNKKTINTILKQSAQFVKAEGGAELTKRRIERLILRM